ncbi:hypothetical protein DCO56_11390 [Sphingobacterium athyrii]|uniref:OmpA-like domain-containing protein n=2 Tax=Sphingobacterium athyrii TaxID=2152717 RepID=A0A363NT30_9SPHI|nr:hypothetical protein DCO56_11390 [Sphingobacterium athyrii]
MMICQILKMECQNNFGIITFLKSTSLYNLNNKSLKLSIDGHIDNEGPTAHNMQLSQQRAEAVLKSLLAKNIAKDRLKSQGFAAEKPLADNNTEKNKAKNRRVELIKM